MTDPKLVADRSADLVGVTCLAAYAWLAVLARGPGEPPLAAFFGIAAWTGGASFWLFLRCRGGRASCSLGRLMIWAALFRLCGLVGGPFYEDDYFRYLWDGHRFATAGTPYGPAPEDFFADEGVPPELRSVLDGINNPDLPTIYAPTTQFAFLLAHWLKPASVAALQAILIAVDLALVRLLAALAPASAVMLYAWSPLVVKEVAFTAHPDGVGVALLFAGILLASRRRWAGGAVCLGLAAAAKVLATPVIPLVLLRAPARCWMVAGASLVAAYAPFVWIGGTDLASLAVFVREWEFNSAVYGLASRALSPTGAKVLLGLAYAGFWALCAVRFRTVDSAAVPRGDWLYGALLAVSPVVNPWYLLWLLPFAAIYPSPWAWTASLAVLLSYVTGLGLGDVGMQPYGQPLWARLAEYGAVAAALGFGLLRFARSRGDRTRCSTE